MSNKSNRCANQSVNPSTSSGLVLKATNRKGVRTVVGVHGGKAASDVQGSRIAATNRATPIGAAATDEVERTKIVAVARHGQLKR